MVFSKNIKFVLLILLTKYNLDVQPLVTNLKLETNQFPYIGKLYQGDDLRCIGIFRSYFTIVIAEKCLSILDNNTNIMVRRMTSDDNRVHQVHHYQPFEYKRTMESSKIAILKFHSNTDESNHIQRTTFDSSPSDYDFDHACIIVGWHKDATNELQYGYSPLEIVSNENCLDREIGISDHQKCAMIRTGFIEDHDFGTPIICGIQALGILDNKTPFNPIIFSFSTANPYQQFMQDVVFGTQRDANPDEFPNVVAVINDDGEVFCGILMDLRHIIVSGRCCVHDSIDELKVFVGRIQIDEIDFDEGFDEGLTVINHFRHDDYDELNEGIDIEYHWNNIGILRLTERLHETPNIGALPFANTPPVPGHVCQFIQWGPISDNEPHRTLEVVEGEVVSTNNCGNLRPFADANFCVRNEHGLDLGDDHFHGSPIICNGVIYGILSEVHTTELDSTPAVFLATSYYKVWLNVVLLRSRRGPGL